MDRPYNPSSYIGPADRSAGNFFKPSTTSAIALAQPPQRPQPPKRPLANITTAFTDQQPVTLPHPTSNIDINTDIGPDADVDAPGCSCISPVSFPLGNLSTPGSASCSRVNSRSYSPTPLPLDSDGSSQLRDPAFAYAPAVPGDDLVPILEGEPLTDSVPEQPPTAPSPLQQRQRKLQQQLESASATAEPLSSTTPARNTASRTTQRQPATTQSDDSAGLYGVYDPSGAVDYLSGPPLLGGEEEEQRGSVTVATATVTASYIVNEEQAAELEQAAEELLLPAVAAAAAAAAAGELQSPADLAATALLLLSGLTATAADGGVDAGAATLGLLDATASAGGAEGFIPPTSSAQALFEVTTAGPTAAHPQATVAMARRKSAGPGASPAATAAAAPSTAATTAAATSTTVATAAGAGASIAGFSHPEWHDYSALPPRYKTSVEVLRNLAAARLMEQHWDAAEHLDVEVTWDAPPIYLQGRNPMRVAVWLAKWAAVVRLEPWMARWTELDSKRTRLELLVEARVRPHRPWWLPASWLLPKQVTLEATLQLRISKCPEEADGSSDVITRIDGSIQNAPKLPMLIRVLTAAAMGYIPSATEALWSPLVGLLGDPSYRNRAEEHPSVVQKATIAAQAVATAAAKRTHQAVTTTVGSARATVESAAEGTADRMADTAAATAGGGGGMLGGAKRAVHEAAEAVRGAVHEVADTVKGGVAAGAEKVTEAAGRAKKAVSGQA